MGSNGRESTSRDRLQLFYEEWLVGHRSLLDELNFLISNDIKDDDREPGRCQALIDKTLSHYQLYFEQRDLIAGDNVFLIFSAPWLSSLEKTYLWIAGFKPSLILGLVESGVGLEGLTAEQLQQLERIKAETKRSERELVEALAVVQERVAAPPLVVLLQRMGHGSIDGELFDVDVAMERMKDEMAGVLQRADTLRGNTMRRAMEVLRPVQVMRFLAVAADFQLRIRRWGLNRDNQGIA